MAFSKELLEILACPKCKGRIEAVLAQASEELLGFGCAACELFYKNEDNIPNFLIEEASPWKQGKGSPDLIA